MTALSCTLTLKFMASGSGDIENPNNSTLDGEQQGSLKGSRRVLQGSRGPRGFGLRNRTLGLQGSAEGTL